MTFYRLEDAIERAQQLANSTGQNFVVWNNERTGLAIVDRATTRNPEPKREWSEHSRYVPEN